MTHPWLAPYTWPMVVEINRLLCVPKGAAHGPTSDGYEETQELWEGSHPRGMTLVEACDLCRRCHRLAPFLNYNGNTFVAVIRQVLSGLSLPPKEAALARSFAGHIVAGTADPKEEADFQRLVQHLTAEPNHGSDPTL